MPEQVRDLAIGGTLSLKESSFREEDKRALLEQNRGDEGKILYENALELFDVNKTPDELKSGLTALIEAAELGNANAQYELGLIYQEGLEFKGLKVPQDTQLAYYYLVQAANQDHVEAMKKLSEISQDEKEGLKWLTKAAALGDREAKFVVGKMQYQLAREYIKKEDYEKAAEILRNIFRDKENHVSLRNDALRDYFYLLRHGLIKVEMFDLGH